MGARFCDWDFIAAQNFNFEWGIANAVAIDQFSGSPHSLEMHFEQ